MKTLLTIFTPTYNRAHTLPFLFEALKRQNDRRFLWLVTDDGSTDGTKELIYSWQKQENGFEIQYIYKSHGGIHTAYNAAITACNTPLFMCIDSDDKPTDKAVADILSFWQNNGSERVAGIVALNSLSNGHTIGNDLPIVKEIHLMPLKYRYKHTGDTKMIYRTQLLQSLVPIPEIDNEKNLNPVWLFLQADKLFPLLVFNKVVCIVDYSTNGMHTQVFYDYMHSPKSYAELRRCLMTANKAPYKLKFRSAIHYVSSCIFAKERHFLSKSPLKFTTVLATPFGIMLNIYIKIKNRE